MDGEKRPFLDEGNDDSFHVHGKCIQCYQHKAPHRRLRYWIISIFVHALIVATSLWFFSRGSSKLMKSLEIKSSSSPTLFNPVRNAIEYQIDTPPANYWDNDLYFGEPTPESDVAWNELMSHQTVRLSGEEAARLNTSAAPLPGGAHATMFGVYHNLHCLRRIRQSLYADYYYQNRSEAMRVADVHHTYHCLEAIRTSVMCHPDFTLHPLNWGNLLGHPLIADPNVPRECVNWDKLMEWQKPRNYVFDNIVEAMHEAGLKIPGSGIEQ